MIVVNTHEAKSTLSKLLSAVENKHEIVRICRNGKPVALLVPAETSTDPLIKHKEIMNVKIAYDPVAPLPEDEWPEECK